MTKADITPKDHNGSLAAQLKSCSKCKLPLPVRLFAKDAQKRDGLRSSCKICQSTQNRDYGDRNREWIRSENRARYAKRPHISREYHKNWYIENKAKKLAQNRAWKAANRQDYTAQQKAYVAKNRSSANLRAREWARRNPEKRALIMRTQNASRRTVTKSGVSRENLAIWLSYQSLFCFYCSTVCVDGFEVDHFHPLAKGGLHEIENLRIACRSCNRRKSSRDPYEFMRSLAARR